MSSAAAPAAEPSVVYAKEGNVARITLNRPKALNALNLDMIRSMTAELARIDADSSVGAIILKGTGKAFCAGGDIKALWGKERTPQLAASQDAFFREEYILDYALAKSSQRKPHVAIYNGVVMGGGVGVSINATFRIATEAATFAMPETAIGLIPDVGGTYVLPRIPQNFGFYLGLSGAKLTGGDLVHAGIATHLVEPAALPELEKEISSLRLESVNIKGTQRAVEEVAARNRWAVEQVINSYSTRLGPFSFKDDVAAYLGSVCSLPTLEQVKSALTDGLKNKEMAGHALQLQMSLNGMSPASMALTLEAMHRGREMSLADCYKQELRLALRRMEGRDFYEGVRAKLIDKTGAPQWSDLKADSNTAVGELLWKHFSPLPADKELQLPL